MAAPAAVRYQPWALVPAGVEGATEVGRPCHTHHGWAHRWGKGGGKAPGGDGGCAQKKKKSTTTTTTTAAAAMARSECARASRSSQVCASACAAWDGGWGTCSGRSGGEEGGGVKIGIGRQQPGATAAPAVGAATRRGARVQEKRPQAVPVELPARRGLCFRSFSRRCVPPCALPNAALHPLVPPRSVGRVRRGVTNPADLPLSVAFTVRTHTVRAADLGVHRRRTPRRAPIMGCWPAWCTPLTGRAGCWEGGLQASFGPPPQMSRPVPATRRQEAFTLAV